MGIEKNVDEEIEIWGFGVWKGRREEGRKGGREEGKRGDSGDSDGDFIVGCNVM